MPSLNKRVYLVANRDTFYNDFTPFCGLALHTSIAIFSSVQHELFFFVIDLTIFS